MARRMILAACLLGCALGLSWNALAGGAPEALGVIERYDAAAKQVYIDGRVYQLRGEALTTLADYQLQAGIGALGGVRVAYRSYQEGQNSYYIDLIELLPSQ